MYKIELKETNDGNWRLELIMPKYVKAVEYNTIEAALKEFHRAYEIRESRSRWPEFIKKAKRMKGMKSEKR